MAARTVKKVILITLISLGGLLLVTLAVVYFSLNSIVKGAIQGFGSDMTKTPVTVASVSMSPFSGSGRLKELAVGNPPGYKSDTAFALKEVFVDLAVMSLLSDTTVIEEIMIDAPEITFEGSLSGSNIGTINQNISAYGSGGTPADAKAPAPEEEAKLIIRRFVMKNAVVRISASTPLGGGVSTLYLPEITLTGIGEKSGGATAAEAAEQIFAPIHEAILRAVADPRKFMDKSAIDAALNHPLKTLQKDMKEAPAKALDDVKGLFKKKK